MIQLNKNWIQDIADTGRCSSRKFTAIIFLLLIDTYLYFLGLFVFHSYIYQWLWPYWELVFAKEMQYNSNTILDEFKFDQYNTIQFLNCLKCLQFNTIQTPLYCISIQFTLYWSTLQNKKIEISDCCGDYSWLDKLKYQNIRIS